MILELSRNTQSILLLTAPLIAGRGYVSPDLLSSAEYKRLARRLREIGRQPADLVSSDAGEILQACQTIVAESRLQRLLGRGFLLSQVVERWRARAIWVVSRADAQYPRRLKARLREDAPPVLYGCGNPDLLEAGGLAVVGSRHVDDASIDFTLSVGRLAARSERMVVSGGAKGVDQAAMLGALEAEGKVCGVLADSLEKTAMSREYRNVLLNGQLTLISPYDPNAGFNVGNAMQRNKLIYALADASLVVSSDLNKGGTWAGAVEQLEKLRFVPVYVRSVAGISAGLEALRRKGAISWPNPQDTDAFENIFDTHALVSVPSRQSDLELFPSNSPGDAALGLSEASRPSSNVKASNESFSAPEPNSAATTSPNVVARDSSIRGEVANELAEAPSTPSDILFATVRDVALGLLKVPMADAEIAAALGVSIAQAKVWLQRLVDEGSVQKQNKPVRYVSKRMRLFN